MTARGWRTAMTMAAAAALAAAPSAGATVPGADGGFAATVIEPGHYSTEIARYAPDGSFVADLTTDDNTYDDQPDWSPDGSRIAWRWTPGRYQYINVENADGTGAAGPISDGINDADPSWSPDGTWIALGDADPFAYFGNVVTVHPDATGGHEITTTEGGTVSSSIPAWSPDGSTIYFVRHAGPLGADPVDIWRMDADGGNQHAVVTGVARLSSLDVSPDGTTLTYATAAGIWTVPVTGGTPHLVGPGSSPTWSPDGTRIGFIGANGQIDTMPAAGGPQTQVTADGSRFLLDVDWRSVPVPLGFRGFGPPVRNFPVVNGEQAGRALPLKFALDRDHGMNVLAAGSPSSVAVACGDTTPASGGTPTRGTLQHDPGTTTYTYVLKTDRAWAGTCRQVLVTLTDGTVHRVLLRLR